MPRNRKCRRVCVEPACRMFRGVPRKAPLELRLDELEAIRLVDLEEFDQVEAAARMEISRGTLQRLLYSAHRQIALALTSGRSIVISDGGDTVAGPTGCDASACRFCCRKHPETASGCLPENRKKGDIMIIAVTCENDNVAAATAAMTRDTPASAAGTDLPFFAEKKAPENRFPGAFLSELNSSSLRSRRKPSASCRPGRLPALSCRCRRVRSCGTPSGSRRCGPRLHFPQRSSAA